MKRITIDWAPNAQKDDLKLAFKLLFSPRKWRDKTPAKRLEEKLSKYIGSDLVAFDSARSALFVLLQTFGIKEKDEVLLQGFTCVALPNPVLWVGAKPVYVDTDLTNMNIDIDDLEKKITSKTKAVIIQYTFGISPDIKRIVEICKKHKLFLIEDCCHNLGQKIRIGKEEKMAGTIGDGAIFSIGMEKVISATRGGFATAKLSKYSRELKSARNRLKKPRFREVIRGLLNPLVWKAREKFGVFGDLIYKIVNILKIHELGLTKLELVGKKASWLPYALPGTNALLALNQFEKIEKYNAHRRDLAKKYYEFFDKLSAEKNDNSEVNFLNNENFQEEISEIKIINREDLDKFADSVYLRFPIFVKNAEEFRAKAKLKNIHLGNWYTEVIHSKGVDLNALGYEKGNCPKSEWLTKHIVNLPTHQGIGEEEFNRIIQALNS